MDNLLTDREKYFIDMDMKMGDIVRANDKKNHPHPIIFIKEEGKDSFIGCIISHESGRKNVKMKPEHFRHHDENGKDYEVQYEDSYLVPHQLNKKNDWIKNVKVVGRLTEEGIKFVISNTSDKTIFHDTHIRNLNV
jgi:hypothetical protein